MTEHRHLERAASAPKAHDDSALRVNTSRLEGVPVLVTGGAGYVGSSVAHHLARAGARVTVLDDLSAGHAHALRGLSLVRADVRDEAALVSVLRETGARAVCHLAALANIPASFDDPARCDAINHGGTRALLSAMNQVGARALVFASTCAVYAPPAPGTVLREGDPEAPGSPYAHSKQRAERAIAGAIDEGQLRAVCFRFFNAAGADRVAGIGEEHEPETHVIPRLLAWARGASGFDLYGTDYPTRDGTCVRDYVHVLDLAEAHARALVRLLDDPDAPVGVCNLGSAVGTSVRELVELVRARTKTQRAIAERPRRDGDAPQLLADVSRAAQWFQWKAERGLEQILDDALWWEAHRASLAR